MAKYFKNIQNLDDLKKQFRKLVVKFHPDNGGDEEAFKELNNEYDALFPIWQSRHNAAAPAENQNHETADSTRSEFYTANGWKGSRYNSSRTLKEIAQIVRAYVKEKYPTYKFSVRTFYASMCQELHVDLKESPVEIYKAADELTKEDENEFFRKANYNNYWVLSSWSDDEFKAEYNRITAAHGNFFKVLNEATKAVIADVDAFVNSYNYSDCDGMIDYFDVDFYYFGCAQNNGANIKIVPKTARIKNKETTPTTNKKSGKNADKRESEKLPESKPELPKNEPEAEAHKAGYTYKITAGEDTRDGSPLWIVRIVETLTKDEYIAENEAMKKRGAYYSKFKKGFLFRVEPSELLKTV